jgi:hypothetical protein
MGIEVPRDLRALGGDLIFGKGMSAIATLVERHRG